MDHFKQLNWNGSIKDCFAIALACLDYHLTDVLNDAEIAFDRSEMTELIRVHSSLEAAE